MTLLLFGYGHCGGGNDDAAMWRQGEKLAKGHGSMRLTGYEATRCVRGAERRGRGKAPILLLSTIIAGIGAIPVQAQTWQGVFTGDWSDAGNWDNSAIPDASSEVVIGTYSNAPVISNGYFANASSVTIGAEFNPSVLTVTDGSVLFTSGGPSFLGFGTDQEGHLNIDANSTWNSNDNVFIGLDGIGRLTITDSTASASSVYIALGESGDGGVSLDGSGFSAANLLVVGGAGDGSLLAQNNSMMSSAEAQIGGLAGSEGSVTLATGSTWSVTDVLFVGNQGEGDLRVLSGSTLTSDIGILGAQFGAIGIARVDGPGSSWTMTSALGAGNDGIGQVQIYNSGHVGVGTQAFLGVQQGGAGSIIIDSQGDLAVAGALNVGIDGEGRILAMGGGTMASTGARLGSLGYGHGTISVEGAGSGWTNTGPIVLGDFGTGRLFVEDGAGVTNTGSTTLGLSPEGFGSLTVNNATFTTTDGLTVGGAGTGLMSISGGGTVTSAQSSGVARIGFGGTGEVVISDNGSSWTNHGQLFVGSMDIGGNLGQGSLLVTDDALLTNNGIAYLGHDSGSTGQAVVSGGTWDNTSALFVGNEGTGVLVIEDGGLVTATNSTIAAAQGATGTVVANGNGVVWNSSGGLAIGGAGQAELIVGNGAIVVAQGLIDAAVLSSSNASVVVDGVLAGLGGVTFNANAHLSGTGIVSAGAAGTTTMNGTIAPGNSIGTLSIFGDYVQNAGSTYEVEIDAAGNSDLIDVSGIATLNGGAVMFQPVDGLALATPYTILTAAGGVNGQFDPVSGAISYFLSPELSYDPNAAYLTIAQSANFESAALTPNQIATAQGADSLPTTNPVWVAIAMLPDAPSAQFAFDQLSGEVHGSVQAVLIDDSRLVREAAFDRLHNAVAKGTEAYTPVLGYAQGGPVALLPETDGPALWVSGFGSQAQWESDGNAAQTIHETGGFALGGDLPLGDWRVGALAGYSHSQLRIDARASSADVDSWYLGIYGGTQWGDVAFKTGAAYGWHAVGTDRAPAFPGFADTLTGAYDVQTGQIFGELAYDLDFETARLTPFFNLAYVHQQRAGFAEQGGPAALSVAPAITNTGFATLGMRGETSASLEWAELTAHAMVGWRHAFGDIATESTHQFSGGTAFDITGTPIARDMAVVEAGLSFRFESSASLDLAYTGQIAGSAQSHGLKARLGVKF